MHFKIDKMFPLLLIRCESKLHGQILFVVREFVTKMLITKTKNEHTTKELYLNKNKSTCHVIHSTITKTKLIDKIHILTQTASTSFIFHTHTHTQTINRFISFHFISFDSRLRTNIHTKSYLSSFSTQKNKNFKKKRES